MHLKGGFHVSAGGVCEADGGRMMASEFWRLKETSKQAKHPGSGRPTNPRSG